MSHLFLIILAAFFAASLVAESPADAALEAQLSQLKAEYQSSVMKSAVKPLELYLSSLVKLELAAAKAKDWETALGARNAAEKAKMALASLERSQILLASSDSAGLEASAVVSLPLSQAKLKGVKYDAGHRWLADWEEAGAASWQLPNLPPGGYEVVLKYTSSAEQGGTVRVQEQFYSVEAATSISLEGSTSHLLGTLRIRDGTGPLTVSALGLAKGGLMRLSAIELIPVTP